MSINVLAKFKDFEGKKFLVVDDFPEFRTAIKRMVEAFGATDIETVNNGEDAVDKISKNKYDAILCDYNLGHGKDGQQVLEETKYRGYLHSSQVFLMLTAESTAEMVMGALEYEPDGYLVKPFNKEMVHTRLIKIIERKAALISILKAMDNNKYDEVISECDRTIAKGGKLVIQCLKLKGQALFFLKEYEKIIGIFTPIAEAKQLLWATMLVGKAHFYLQDFEKALEYFNKIVEINPVNVEGYDWIAKVQLAKGDQKGAQNTLVHAISLSSKAILRQQALADIAYDNGSLDVAEKAYKTAVVLGKHSCYHRPRDSLRYADILLDKVKRTENERVKVRNANEAVSILEALNNMHRHKPESMALTDIMLVQAFLASERKDKAHSYALRAFEAYEDKGIEIEKEYLNKLAEFLSELNDKERAMTIYESLGVLEGKDDESI